MIYYNSNTIKDWNFGDDNIIKVYRNNAVCYYKITGGGDTPTAQTPCFAVVDDISQYSDTEFEDVFNKADNKWYKLNNLNQYEQYGIYGSGRTITTYEGKLTIDEETSSRLPQGYTEVEYIENTSYVANTKSTSRFNVIGDSSSGNIYTIVYDLYDDSGRKYLHIFGNNVNILMQKIQQVWGDKCIHFKFYGLDAYAESTPLSTKAQIKIDSNSIIITNLSASTSTTTTYGGSIRSVNETHYGVFCCYNNNDSGAHSMVGKIYEIKIESSNHELKNHYIPCYRDSDNKVGLYDIVGDAFYYDESNTLTLTAGSAVTPSTTETCEFIYSGNSWVNLGEVSGSSITIKSPEYIERTSTYNGYLSLQEYFTQDTKIIVKHRQTTDGGGAFIGDYINNDNDDWRVFFASSTLCYDFITQRKSTSKTMPMSTAEEWEIGNYYIKKTATGTNLLTGTTQTFSSRPNQMYLYYLGNFGNVSDYGQVYYLKIYRNDVLIRDFIPWTDMNGNYGFYDKVENELVHSIGNMTGSSNVTDVEVGGGYEYPLEYVVREDPPNNVSFTSMTEAEEYECPWVGMSATINGSAYTFSGDAISGYEWVYNPSRLPQGYTEVEYVQNSGTSYLNTNFVPNQDTRVVCDMQMVTASNFPRLWGAGTWNSANGLMIDYEGGYLQMHWLGKTSWTSYPSVPQSFDRKVYDVNKNYLYVDSVQIGSDTYTTRTASDPIGVFTYIGSGRPSSSSYWGQEHFKGKMYSFQIYDNGTLVRDLVPCIRDNDNTVGAYDLVNDVFYSVPTGYTTDKLVAGPTV